MEHKMHTTYNALINSLQQNTAMQNAAKNACNDPRETFLAMLEFVLAEQHNYTLAQQEHNTDDVNLLHLHLVNDYW